MKKRIFLGAGLGLIAAIGIVFTVPASRYPLLGMMGIERLHNGRPIAYWIAALKTGDPESRRRAAMTLGDTGIGEDRLDDAQESQRVLKALIEALGDSDGLVRKCAATSLLMYPRDTAVPQENSTVAHLTGALRDDEVAVRQAAVRTLWQAGAAAKEADGIARLRDALTDKNDFVRAYAARALAKIGPDAEAAAPALVKCLREDEERDVRKLAAKTLGLIGARAIGPAMPEAVEGLTQGLKDENRGFREYSARSLGQLGAKDAIPALRPLLKDRDESVRAAAAEALRLLEPAGS